MSTTKKRALVTGASGGIGLELARLLAADGHDLALVARREDRLQSLAAELTQQHRVNVLVIPADLADPAAPLAVAERLHRDSFDVDVLINNAGFGGFGPFVERPLDDELAMIQVNVTSLVALTRLLLPGMVTRGHGRILNVSSTAAFQPGPLMAVYYATKAFVQSFSEAIANELSGTGVTVTALCPGPTRTGFQTAAGLHVSRLFASERLPDGAAVARQGYQAMMRGRRVLVTGWLNKIAAQSYRFAPRRLLTASVRLLQDTKS